MLHFLDGGVEHGITNLTLPSARFNRMFNQHLRAWTPASARSEAQLSGSVRHNSQTLELSASYETLLHYTFTFTDLTSVSFLLVQIGEKLETADKQRARAVLSKKLMEYFMQFNDGGCPTLESLMTQQGLEGQIEAARILRQLAVISKEVDLPETQVVCGNLVCPRNYMYLVDPHK